MTLQCSAVLLGGGNNPASTLSVNIFRIELDRCGLSRRDIPEFSPGEEITGKLFLTCDDSFHCKRIYVALEGTEEVEYETTDSYMSRDEDISLDKNITRVMIMGGDFKTAYVCIEKSDHEYRFSIPTKKTRFAGTLVEKHGKINYRVEACIDTRHPANRKITSERVKMKSYLNLQSIPETLKPATVEAQQYKSLFSKKTGLKYSLSLPCTGFLPGEQIPFSLFLVNPNGLHVTKCFVALARKLTYKSQYSSKFNKTYLAFVENTDAESMSEWSNSVRIPKNTYPSVSVQIIQHKYTLRVEIYVDGNESPTLQGDVNVTIGTTRGTEATLSPIPKNNLHGFVTRSQSARSIMSRTDSQYSFLPPAYSQLSSRTASLYSIETLPPFYADAVKEDVGVCDNKQSDTARASSGGPITKPKLKF